MVRELTTQDGQATNRSEGLSIDRRYLVDTASMLARVPTDVPLSRGYETYTEPDDPKLVHYVQDVLRPELYKLGAYELIDIPKNNLVVRLGSGRTGHSLLIQTYTVAQHYQYMDDPYSGKIAVAREWGLDEPAIFARGANQKAHQAIMLAVLRALIENDVPIEGRLYWAINNEGRSSHECTSNILAAIDRPDFAILQLRRDLAVSLGNRGRVDINVHIKGKATHSSQPERGLSSIEGFWLFLERLRTLTWQDSHPLLGSRQAIPYKTRFEPVAPHTLPSDAYLTIDRRLLPGDDVPTAVQEIRDVVGDLSPYEVSIEPGVTMLPALIDPDDPHVQALDTSFRRVTGTAISKTYHRGAYDAGGTASVGIPTVMFGCGGGAGQFPLGVDFVPISEMITEARVLADFVTSNLS